MPPFENVVGGKLKLKGKALNVKTGGLKKKKHGHHRNDSSEIIGGKELLQEDGSSEPSRDSSDGMMEGGKIGDGGHPPTHDNHLTPAERGYIEQREKIDVRRLAKTANKSHRDRIQDLNQYLANMSEHYDIPKVGPG